MSNTQLWINQPQDISTRGSLSTVTCKQLTKQLTKTVGSKRSAVDWFIVAYCSSVNFTPYTLSTRNWPTLRGRYPSTHTTTRRPLQCTESYKGLCAPYLWLSNQTKGALAGLKRLERILTCNCLAFVFIQHANWREPWWKWITSPKGKRRGVVYGVPWITAIMCTQGNQRKFRSF